MSIVKGHPADTTVRKPYDDKGRFISTKCEQCGNGTLRYQGDGFWSCDGLADPEHNDKELEACPAFHYDGEPAAGVAIPRRFDDDWAPNPNDDQGEDRPNDPHDDLTPGADPTDRAGVKGLDDAQQ